MSTIENNPVEREIRLAETRAERLRRIVDGYEIYEEGMPDSTVPGAAKIVNTHGGKLLRRHPRYVLITQYAEGNYRLRLGEDVHNIEQLAADAATDAEGAELVVCYYDLDQLAGEGPIPVKADYKGHTWMVHGEEYGDRDPATNNPTKTGRWILKRSPDDRRRSSYDWEHVDPDELTNIVTTPEEDERMPVRYALARVVTIAVFNTRPERP